METNAVGIEMSDVIVRGSDAHLWYTFEASSVSMSFSSSRMLPVDSNNNFKMVSSILFVCVCVCWGGGDGDGITSKFFPYILQPGLHGA